MAEETTVTPTTDEIVEEGSVASIAEVPPEQKPEETVPLSVLLDMKADVKRLKQELKNATVSQVKSEERASIKALTEKYPEVDADFIKGIVGAAVQETEAKYEPIIQKQEADRKQAEFDKAFDTIFDKATKDNPKAKNVDKDVIKTLALTPQYNNTPVADIIAKIYGTDIVGKATTENDMRVVPDVSDENIDVEHITPDQRDIILANPKTRKQYYDRLDALGR